MRNAHAQAPALKRGVGPHRNARSSPHQINNQPASAARFSRARAVKTHADAEKTPVQPRTRTTAAFRTFQSRGPRFITRRTKTRPGPALLPAEYAVIHREDSLNSLQGHESHIYIHIDPGSRPITQLASLRPLVRLFFLCPSIRKWTRSE